MDDARDDRRLALNGRCVPGDDQQDDSYEAGRDGRRPRQRLRSEEEDHGAQRGDPGAGELEQARPALDEVRRARSGLETRRQRGHQRRDRGQCEPGSDQLRQPSRHRSLPQHQPLEGRQAERCQQTEIREPAPEDADDIRVAMAVAGRDRQASLHVADAEVEEALGEVPVGGREAAPHDRVDPVSQLGCFDHERVRVIGIDVSRAFQDLGSVERGEVQRGDLRLQRLAEDEADLVGRLGQDRTRPR